MAKNGKTIRLTKLPEPALTSVPEPQESTICIAMPNKNAPATMAKPIGAAAPVNSPARISNNGIATIATKAIARNCPKIPEGSRLMIIARHGPANPNRSPSSTNPKPMPTASNSP